MESLNEVTIERSIDTNKLWWPEELSLVTDDHFVRGYQDLRGLTWEDVIQTLIIEKEIIEQHSGDLNKAEDSIYEEEDIDAIFNLYGLDLGIASAVVALSAANCASISSCNGAIGHHEDYPLVAFYCRKGRIEDIVKAAEDSDCGLFNGNAGDLVLYSGNVHNLIKFAEVLLSRRECLKPLSKLNPKNILE